MLTEEIQSAFNYTLLIYMNQSTISDKKTESDIIDVKFDTPQKVKIPVVGVRNYSDDMGLELSELFDKYPIGTTMFLRINKTGEKYAGSVSLFDVMSNKIGSLGKVVRRYIELAIPKDGILPCTVVGHSLKHHAIYVEAINNVGIKKPYIRNSAPEENEIIFETTEHDKKIQMMTQMLLTLLDSDNPNAEQILAIAKEYAKICCTTLDGDTVFKVYDIRRKLEALNEKSNNMFDDVISEIFENEKDLGRRQNDVKTRVYLEQFNRILESAKKGEKDKSSQLENYRKNLEFVNTGKLPKRVVEDEIKHLSELLAKELMGRYPEAVDNEIEFAKALYSLNYNLRSMYVLYTRRIKRDYLLNMLQEYDEVKTEDDKDIILKDEKELCISLNRSQRQMFDKAEEEGIIKYNAERKGYDKGECSSKVLIAYFCGKLFCGDYVEDKGWKNGGRFDEAKFLCELFGFDVAGTRRKQIDTEKLPTGYKRVDKLFKKK